MTIDNRFNEASAIASVVFSNHNLVEPIKAYFSTFDGCLSKQNQQMIDMLDELRSENNDSDYFYCLRKALRNLDQSEFEVVRQIVTDNNYILLVDDVMCTNIGKQSITISGSNNNVIQGKFNAPYNIVVK